MTVEKLLTVGMDEYRAIALVRRPRAPSLEYDKNFNSNYPRVVNAPIGMPDDTVLDGEIVAFDESGHPSLNALRNHGSHQQQVVYYVFDVLMLSARTNA